MFKYFLKSPNISLREHVFTVIFVSRYSGYLYWGAKGEIPNHRHWLNAWKTWITTGKHQSLIRLVRFTLTGPNEPDGWMET